MTIISRKGHKTFFETLETKPNKGTADLFGYNNIFKCYTTSIRSSLTHVPFLQENKQLLKFREAGYFRLVLLNVPNQVPHSLFYNSP